MGFLPCNEEEKKIDMILKHCIWIFVESKKTDTAGMKPISFSIRTPHNVLHQQNIENALIREFFQQQRQLSLTTVGYRHNMDDVHCTATERYHISSTAVINFKKSQVK